MKSDKIIYVPSRSQYFKGWSSLDGITPYFENRAESALNFTKESALNSALQILRETYPDAEIQDSYWN